MGTIKMSEKCVSEWTKEDTKVYLENEGLREKSLDLLCDNNEIDGKCLLALTEIDFRMEPINQLTLRDRKILYVCVKILQRENHSSLLQLGLLELPSINLYSSHHYHRHESEYCDSERLGGFDRVTPPMSEDGRAQRLQPEIWKAFLSFCYVVTVTWITAFVMVIVHDRVPDMKKYPPLPDIFLDNVPHIPWAFDMCEITGTILFTIWTIVLIFHKHSNMYPKNTVNAPRGSATAVTPIEMHVEFILLRRFFALSGTVFLLRCVTMLITSLSVPGAHLQCQPRNTPEIEPKNMYKELSTKISQAYVIWRGAGMSIQGVRTCGDYMFSGHTVALTMLNFFITEYTPRHFYFLHTLTWLMNMFGIFFILAAHEHYSIDVFVAFYITSRLFLYYHTLSNNQALMQRDSTRTRIWFPMFSFFENSVDGIVPNEYDKPSEIIYNIFYWVKDKCVSFSRFFSLFSARYSTNETRCTEQKKEN